MNELDWVKGVEDKLNHDFKEKSKIDYLDIYSLFFAFINRARFSYTIRDIFAYLFKCMCIRGVSNNRNKSNFKKHFLFQKAGEKFKNELDAVHFVKALRKFKMLAQAMLS